MSPDTDLHAQHAILDAHLTQGNFPVSVQYLGMEHHENELMFYLHVGQPLLINYEPRFLFQIMQTFMTAALLLPGYRDELWALREMKIDKNEGQWYILVKVSRDSKEEVSRGTK